MSLVLAAERYEVSVRPPTTPIAVAVSLVAVGLGVLSSTEWARGRRRATVTERATGALVGDFEEPLVVNNNTRFGVMLAAHATQPADDFERVWLRSTDNRIKSARDADNAGSAGGDH